MAAKIVKFGGDAREKVLRGVNVLADAVTWYSWEAGNERC